MKELLKYDLDTFSIGSYRLGEKTNHQESVVRHLKDGYLVLFKNGIIDGFNVFFYEIHVAKYIPSMNLFKGDVLFKNKKLNIDKYTQPEYIIEQFGNPVDFWDDEVEVNYTFMLQNSIVVEFAWTYENNDNTKPLFLNYIELSKTN